jgi:hypothetical protein
MPGDPETYVLALRCRRELVAQLDALAESVNRPRSEVVRYLLTSAGPECLPAGWREDANTLKLARTVAR